jgi:predicted ATPase/DNA-binding SARP family transcriptional activator
MKLLRLFGHPALEEADHSASLALREKALALATLLATSGERPLSRVWLGAALWPDADAVQGRANLRRHVHILRRAFGDDVLRVDARSVAWNGELLDVDVLRFERFAAVDPQRAVDEYRGELCPGLDDDVIAPARERYRSRCLELLAKLLDEARVRADGPSAIAYARRLLELDPLHEPAARALMHELDRAGDAVAAISEYRAFAARLRGELGVVPDEDTVQLFRKLAEERASLHERGNVPAEDSSFVGREDELRRVRDGLQTHGIVTIVGPGGAGKSRLAWRSAALQRRRYANGIWNVAIASDDDADAVWARLAATMGLQGANAHARVLRRLQEPGALVVLDECERALDVARVFASDLRQDTDVHLIATSRRMLHVAGEVLVEVGELDVPERTTSGTADLLRFSAYRLFVERAVAAKPSFRVGPENARAIVALLRRVGALPLIVELTAARVRSLSPQQLLERADDAPLSARLDAAIASSYDALDEAARAALATVSIFHGSFSLHAAEALLGKTAADVLPQLCEASLLRARERDDEMRYELLDAVRAYASARLRDASTMRARHAAYFVALAREFGAHFRSPDEVAYFRRADAEAENFAAALRWTAEHDAPAAAALSRSLAYYYVFRWDFATISFAVERLLEAPEGSLGIRERADALLADGLIAKARVHADRAESSLREADDLFDAIGDRAGRAEALFARSVVIFNRGRMDEAIALFDRSIELLRAAGDDFGAAQALLNRAAALTTLAERWEEALALQREALAAFERLGYVRGVGYAYRAISLSLSNLAHMDEAIEAIRASVEIFDVEDDDAWLADALALYANQLCEAGRHAESLPVLRRGLSTVQRAPFPVAERNLCLALFEALVENGAWRDAATAYGRAMSLGKRHALKIAPNYDRYLRPLRERAAAELGEASFRALCVKGGAADVAALLSALDRCAQGNAANGAPPQR